MKKLVLDLDETLLYSTTEAISPECVKLSAAGSDFYTMLRPGVREFLQKVAKKFECTIWSTGQQAYLESAWEYIGVEGFTLWGRGFCKKIETTDGSEPYEKPLRQITEDLTQIVLVDNTPSLFAKCPLNGILTRTWRGDMNDTELNHLWYYLNWLQAQPNMQRNHEHWRIETLCLRNCMP